MQVKVIREHVNMYGDKPKKAVDAEYDLPENMAKTLIDAGLVAKVEASAEPAGKGAKAK